jgi:hypothetical protein
VSQVKGSLTRFLTTNSTSAVRPASQYIPSLVTGSRSLAAQKSLKTIPPTTARSFATHHSLQSFWIHNCYTHYLFGIPCPNHFLNFILLQHSQITHQSEHACSNVAFSIPLPHRRGWPTRLQHPQCCCYALLHAAHACHVLQLASFPRLSPQRAPPVGPCLYCACRNHGHPSVLG